jgi:hypothetical protein
MSALRTHGTITFDAAIIRGTIAFSQADALLDVGHWLALVPECYRDRAAEGVRVVGARYVGKKMRPESLIWFAEELSRWLVENIEPIDDVLRGGTEGGR